QLRNSGLISLVRFPASCCVEDIAYPESVIPACLKRESCAKSELDPRQKHAGATLAAGVQ
ncbi:MAG: hypothetical protein ACM37Z_00565, partial [Deltaproteobacteria bacterium]